MNSLNKQKISIRNIISIEFSDISLYNCRVTQPFFHKISQVNTTFIHDNIIEITKQWSFTLHYHFHIGYFKIY